MFAFLGLEDFTIGTLNDTALIESLNDVATNGSDPTGFSFGDYAAIRDGQGNAIRRLRNASFAPTAVIDRVVTVATDELFTYTFEQDGSTFHVQHKPYATAFPNATFPAELQMAIDRFFSAL